MIREWWVWAQVAQHEWWFIPAGLGLLVGMVGLVAVVKIAASRISSRLLNPRMRGTEDQVEAVWATEADLVQFGLIKPMKRGIWRWISRTGR